MEKQAEPTEPHRWRAFMRRVKETRRYYRLLGRVACAAMKAGASKSLSERAAEAVPYLIAALVLGGVGGGAIGQALWGNIGLIVCALGGGVSAYVVGALIYAPVAVWLRQNDRIRDGSRDFNALRRNRNALLVRASEAESKASKIERVAAALIEQRDGLIKKNHNLARGHAELDAQLQAERNTVPTRAALLEIFHVRCSALVAEIEQLQTTEADWKIVDDVLARMEALLVHNLTGPKWRKEMNGFDEIKKKMVGLARSVGPPVIASGGMGRWLEEIQSRMTENDMKHPIKLGPEGIENA